MIRFAFITGVVCGVIGFCHASTASLIERPPQGFGEPSPLATDIALALTAANSEEEQSASLWFARHVTTRQSETADTLPENMVREALSIESKQRPPAAEGLPSRPRSADETGATRLPRGTSGNGDAGDGDRFRHSYGVDASTAPEAKQYELAEPVPTCCGSQFDQGAAYRHSTSAAAPGVGSNDPDSGDAFDTVDDSLRYRTVLAPLISALAAHIPPGGPDLPRQDTIAFDTTGAPLPPRPDGLVDSGHLSRNQIEAFLQVMLAPRVVCFALVAIGVSLAVVSLRAIWVSGLMFAAAAVLFIYSNL